MGMSVEEERGGDMRDGEGMWYLRVGVSSCGCEGGTAAGFVRRPG